MEKKYRKASFLTPLFLIFLLLHSSTFVASGDTTWNTYKNDNQRTGFSSSSSPTTNHVLWEYETGGEVKSSPVVDNETVFVSAGDCTLYAIDLFSGNLKWKFTHDGTYCSASHSSPAAFDGKVIYSTTYNGIFCIDQTTGEQIWHYETTDSVDSSPLVRNNKVFITLWNEEVIALTANTGELIWNYDTNGSNSKSSPTYYEGEVYVPSYEGVIYVLDADTGSELHTIELINHIQTPIIADGKLFVNSSVNNAAVDNFFVLDLGTLDVNWEKKTGTYVRSSPSVAYEKVFVGGDQLRAYDTQTGQILWYYDNAMETDPAVADGKVFANINNKLIAFDQETGTILWQGDIGQSEASPSISNGVVLVGSNYPSKVMAFYAYSHDVAVSNFDVPSSANPGELLTITVTVSNEGLSDEENIEVDFLMDDVVVDSQKVTSLSSLAEQQLTFDWTPPLENYICELSVKATQIVEDNNMSNNQISRDVAVGGKTIAVPSEFATIAAAIDYADPGDTIEIAEGTYAENLVIEKSNLKLLGQPQSSVVISGNKPLTTNPVTINGDGCQLSGIQIENGPAHSSGAGIVINSSNNIIRKCTITNNGNGIMLNYGSSNNLIEECLIKMNTNHGIEINYSSDDNIIRNCVIRGNNSSSYPCAGIYISGNQNEVDGCAIHSNKDNGITLVAATHCRVINTTINSNGGTGIQLFSGYNGDSTDNFFQGCTIDNNYQGLFIGQNWSTISPNNVFRNNNIQINTYNLNIERPPYCQDIDKSNFINGKPIWFLCNKSNMVIDGNKEEIGALILYNCDNMHVKNVILSNNRQGLIIGETSNSIIENCEFQNNYDGIYSYYSSSNIFKNCTGNNNHNGIHMDEESEHNKIEGCTLRNNSNAGVYLDLNSHYNEVGGSEFYFNNIGLLTNSSMGNFVRGSKIYSNTKGIVFGDNSFDGGVITCDVYNNEEDGITTFSDQYIVNNTIYGNNGFGINANHNIQVLNSILWNNNGNFNYADLQVSFCNVEGGYIGEGNIVQNPMFKDPVNGNYNLKNGSPCIDAGIISGFPVLELDGDNDLVCLPDIGAHEFFGKPDVFGLSIGNQYFYERKMEGNTFNACLKIVLYDKINDGVPLYVLPYLSSEKEIKIEYYEKRTDQVKLRIIEPWNPYQRIQFAEGLTKYWQGMTIGEQRVSSSSVSIPGVVDNSLRASLGVSVLKQEKIEINDFSVTAFKIKYELRVWGDTLPLIQNEFTEWLVPHIGVVKYSDDMYEDRLLSFSIGGGFIEDTSKNMIYYSVIRGRSPIQPAIYLLLNTE